MESPGGFRANITLIANLDDKGVFQVTEEASDCPS
jgi:hypothetical protein